MPLPPDFLNSTTARLPLARTRYLPPCFLALTSRSPSRDPFFSLPVFLPFSPRLGPEIPSSALSLPRENAVPPAGTFQPHSNAPARGVARLSNVTVPPPLSPYGITFPPAMRPELPHPRTTSLLSFLILLLARAPTPDTRTPNPEPRALLRQTRRLQRSPPAPTVGERGSAAAARELRRRIPPRTRGSSEQERRCRAQGRGGRQARRPSERTFGESRRAGLAHHQPPQVNQIGINQSVFFHQPISSQGVSCVKFKGARLIW